MFFGLKMSIWQYFSRHLQESIKPFKVIFWEAFIASITTDDIPMSADDFLTIPSLNAAIMKKKKKKQWKWRNSERFEEGRGGEDQRVEPGLPHSSVVGVPCQWMACSTYRKNGIVKFAMFWVLPCLLVWRFPSGLSKIFSFVCLMCWQISLCQLRQSCFQVQLVC